MLNTLFKWLKCVFKKWSIDITQTNTNKHTDTDKQWLSFSSLPPQTHSFKTTDQNMIMGNKQQQQQHPLYNQLTATICLC